MKTALGIAAGFGLDRVFGDPQRHHPVAWFGTYALWLERHLYRKGSRAAGAAYVAACVLPPTALAVALQRRFPLATTAAATWAALGGTSLERTGLAMARDLERGDVEAARAWVPWLCSRDSHLLDAAGMARAAVESIAENTSDAAIAPLVWGALGGAPAVVAHRAINTLDAMVGYKSERYLEFGWAAARLDDAVAWIPARLTAAVHVALAGGARRADAIRAWKTQAFAHPSPNAGPVEATAAGALGVRLGGTTVYSYGVEHRPELGFGEPPRPADIARAVRLARRTQVLTAGAAVLLRSGLLAAVRAFGRSGRF